MEKFFFVRMTYFFASMTSDILIEKQVPNIDVSMMKGSKTLSFSQKLALNSWAGMYIIPTKTSSLVRELFFSRFMSVSLVQRPIQ